MTTEAAAIAGTWAGTWSRPYGRLFELTAGTLRIELVTRDHGEPRVADITVRPAGPFGPPAQRW